jgi:hypothetical protein
VQSPKRSFPYIGHDDTPTVRSHDAGNDGNTPKSKYLANSNVLGSRLTGNLPNLK